VVCGGDVDDTLATADLRGGQGVPHELLHVELPRVELSLQERAGDLDPELDGEGRHLRL